MNEHDKYFNISVPVWSDDMKLFTEIVNIGIDARLEGFVKSKFYQNGNRYYLDFHREELQILVRRLYEHETEEAESWADDIVQMEYGIEII